MEEILTTLLMFLPLVAILWLANMADRQRTAGREEAGRVLALAGYALLALLYLLLIGMGAIFHVLGSPLAAGLAESLDQSYEQMGVRIASFTTLGMGMWAPGLLGIILLLPPVRRAAGRLVRGLDPASTIHAVALSYTMLILVNLFMTVGFGIRNLATMIESDSSGIANIAPLLWVQELVWLFMAAIGVGWLSRSSLKDTLGRLGLVRPRPLQVLFGVLCGAAAAGLIVALEYGVSRIGVTGDADVARLTEQMLGPLTQSLPGILTLGVAAALGEEPIFRGALQPRFGILLTSVFFALLHSTYGLTLATLFVLLVGLILGLVRKHANTTTAMLVHACYNMSLGLISYLGMFQSP